MEEKISVEGQLYPTSEDLRTWDFDFVHPVEGSCTEHLETEVADLSSLGAAIVAALPHHVGKWDVYVGDGPPRGWLRVSADGTVDWGWL